MNYPTRIMLLAATMGLCVACSSQADSTQASNAQPSGAGHCLQQHAGKLDTLLTKQDIAPYVGDAAGKVETDYEKQFEDHITYTWPSDRTMTMMGSTYPADSKIGLGGLKTYSGEGHPVQWFKSRHHNMTQKEKKKAHAAINAQLQKQGQTAGSAGNAITGAATSGIKFDAVSGVGDAAAWDYLDKALAVLTGDTEFKVFAEVSADTDRNKAVARKLANSILADCAANN